MTKFLNSTELFGKYFLVSNLFFIDPLDKYQKMKLIDGLQEIDMVYGEFVFHQGDEGHEFYIIEKGMVECLIESGDELTCVRVLK